jgi:general secretion pathway protein I
LSLLFGIALASCRGPRAPARSRGFGLLEAIVALTILASSGLALFAWIQQNLQTAARLKLKEQQAALILNAQALLETVNPSAAPSGEIVQGALAVRWSGSLIEPARPNAGFAAPATGDWMVGLYRLQVRASEGAVEAEFSMLKAGTQRQQVARSKP